MKYAFHGRDSGFISISFSVVNNNVTLIVQDNGNGLPVDFETSKSTGFGLMLVGMLSIQIVGEYSFENHKGTRFTLNFEI